MFSLSLNRLVRANFGVQLEGYAENFRQRYTPSGKADPQIVLVGLDDKAMQPEFFNRKTHAKVLETLANYRVRAIFFDLIFDEDRDPQSDALLKKALEKAPPTVLAGASALIDTEEGESIIPPRLAPSLQACLEGGTVVIGAIEKPASTFGTDWPYFLAIDFGGEKVPSAALALYSLYQAVNPANLNYKPTLIEVPPVNIPIKLSLDPSTGLGIYQFQLKFHPPATGPGHQPTSTTYQVIPYLDLLHPNDELQQKLRQKIVIIGENTSSETDLVATPVGQIKGFEAHAQCFNRILHQEFFHSPSPKVNLGICLVLISALSLVALLAWPLPLLIALGPLLAFSYTALNILVYSQNHIVLELASPLVAITAAYSSLILIRLALTSQFLARFIPQEAASAILSDQVMAKATQATVIVTDIRGYTSLSETRTPVEMLKLLNEYHSVTVDIYHQHGGSVLTFQGDAQLIVFGYPRRLKDAAKASVMACTEVMDAIAKLRKKWGISEAKDFDVGAGICTGLVYIGDIGSREQANYTVIGEVVRTSHKVQSMSTTLKGNVLLDETTFQACLDKPAATRIENVQLEGFPEPKTLYRVEFP